MCLVYNYFQESDTQYTFSGGAVTVKHTLLALLNHTPTHGYELHRLMETALGDHWVINTGQIYSTLSRLERDGLVVRQPASVDEAAERTAYELTQDGRAELERWYREPLSRDYRLRDAFHAKLMLSLFSGPVPPGEVLQAQRRELLSEMHELTHMRAEADPASELPWLLLLESAIMHLEADLRWLDVCEARLDELRRMPPPRHVSRPRGRPPRRSQPDETS
jgi:DNA-binding PadR family transcriptional regulator